MGLTITMHKAATLGEALQIIGTLEMEDINQLTFEIHNQFDHLGDYIWKAPEFVEQQTIIELNKLEEYFPGDSHAQSLRWSLEAPKLELSFPRFIAKANLLLAVSLFEYYLLSIDKAMMKHKISKLKPSKRRGIQGCFERIRARGVEYDTLDFYGQIEAAVEIRNCVIHADGIL